MQSTQRCVFKVFYPKFSVHKVIISVSLVYIIEIIDIECVLLSFLSKKFVSTKWRIEKGILVGPRLLRQGISRGCRECNY